MEHVIVTTRPAAAEPAREAAKPELIEALLAALTDMAVRSPRRQADLAVALRRSGLRAPPMALREALMALEEDGCIENLVPLADGGLLMMITAHGIERLAKSARRDVLGLTG